MNKKNLSLVLFFLIFSHLATSQDKKTWDVNKPEGEWKSVKFSTDEGSNGAFPPFGLANSIVKCGSNT